MSVVCQLSGGALVADERCYHVLWFAVCRQHLESCQAHCAEGGREGSSVLNAALRPLAHAFCPHASRLLNIFAGIAPKVQRLCQSVH